MTALIIHLSARRNHSPKQGPFALKNWQGRACRVLHQGKSVAWIERIDDTGRVERRHVLLTELSGIGERLGDAES